MKKIFLDTLYERRESVRRRKNEHTARKDFDGSNGSCDHAIHKMQSAEIFHQLAVIDEFITDYLVMHGAA